MSIRVILVLICGTLLTATPGGGAEPADSPAAKLSGSIIFSSNRGGNWRIWAAEPDGSRLRQITRGEDDASDVDPVFSPDGKAILFTSTRGKTTGIWQMAADGTKPVRICDGDQAEWSPDAKQIAFRRAERLFARELATGREQRLTPEDFPHCSGPAWSPDGKTIAFACRWDAGNGLYTIPAAGGEPGKVYDRQPACEPHWSADGTRLVYETETRICTIQPDGKKNRPVTLLGGVQRFGRFSPDGQWIVYCQGASERGPWELYLIPAGGGTPTRLTEGGSDMYPDWR